MPYTPWTLKPRRPRPLSPTQLLVLRKGARSTGLGGVCWSVEGEPVTTNSVSTAVRGLLQRGLIQYPHMREGDHMKTSNTAAGDEAAR